MKRLMNVLAWMLALNFLALAGGAGWLWRAGRLDREKVHAVRDLLFPAPVPTTQPVAGVDPATTQPTYKLEEMLAQYAGLPATEQLQHIRQTFDAKLAQLELAQRSLNDLQRTVRLAQEKLAADRVAFEQQKGTHEAKEQESSRLAADKGFQDTLALYSAMPPKQAKGAFMTMDDATVVRYLQAMESRAASKILKEFKSSDEIARVSRVLELMRQAPGAAEPAAVPAPAAGPRPQAAAAR